MPPPLPRAALALGGVFFLLGFVGATWVSRIPAVQGDLGLGDGALGAALVGLPAGSVAAAAALPALVARVGSRRVVVLALPASAAALLLPGLARGPVTLALALAVLGAATGALDVAMNTHGVAVEREVGRSVFARLHALWSLGGFVGAGVGFLVARVGLDPPAHFLAVAVVVAAVGVPVARALSATDDPAEPTESAHRRWSRHPVVVTLAAVCVAAFVVEIVAADWGGVFVHRVVGAAAATAAGAYAAFALPHFVVRAAGDPVLDRVPPRPLLAGALVVSAAGFLVLVTAPSPPVALLGLAVAGAGAGLVVPVGFGAAGRVPGVPAGAGVATAAGASYVAWTAAPAVVGGVSAATGLRVALLLAPVAAVLAAVAVGRSRRV